MLNFKIITLVNGKRILDNVWNFLLFNRRTFIVGEDIFVPSDKVLQLHSPIIDGELKIDGEVYIL